MGPDNSGSAESGESLRILSFNWHEPYLAMLARTGHVFDVAEPELGRNSARKWNTAVRQVPDNVTPLPWEACAGRLEEGRYDLAVCHNFGDMALVAGSGTPAILVFHNKLSTELALGGGTVERGRYLGDVAPLAEKAGLLVFVSEAKRDDWGLHGLPSAVIKPGVDVAGFGPYDGDVPKILCVGNLMKHRDVMLGYGVQKEITDGLPATLLGVNPGIEGAGPAESFEQLKSCYASHRLYLNTTAAPFEDGYNLAMLEAMATGMPVVSTANPTSPITDGVEGYVSDDLGRLREKAEALLDDHALARELGAAAREKAAREFSLEKFAASWRGAFRAVMEGAGERRIHPRGGT